MSGIYGVTRDGLLSESMRSLGAWNKRYGSQHDGISIGKDSGCGWSRERFLDAYGADMPKIKYGTKYYVIDTLIYNRDELLPLVENAKDDISDEMLMIRLIEKFGMKVLEKINGDFAGAIYDNGKWILFRDHLGIRPLYYYKKGNIFAFSTDMRGLTALPEVDLSVDEKWLYLDFMHYDSLNLDGTEFRNIRCVMPGCWHEFTDGTETKHAYWEMCRKKIKLGSREAYAKEMRRLVEDAIRRRMAVMPEPYGAELSGGLDSSVIDILISHLGGKLKLMTWSNPEEEIPLQERDERKVIEDVCRQEGFECTYLKAEEFKDSIEKDLLPPFVNTLQLSYTSEKLRQMGARCVFTGQGGDESVSHRVKPISLLLHGEIVPYVKVHWYATEGKKLRTLRLVKRITADVLAYKNKVLKGWAQPDAKNSTILNSEFVEKMKDVKPPVFYFGIDEKKETLAGGQRSRLDNVAFQGAEHGVRYLIPFMDYRVYDYALSIPRYLYVHKGVNRYMYREAFKDIMPKSLQDVHYKDVPSVKGKKKTADDNRRLKEELDKVLSKLDRDLWSKYIDFGKVEKLEGWAAEDESKNVAFALNLSKLMICQRMQDLMKRSYRWAQDVQ